VPVGAPGELYLGGDGLARGYLGRPDLTAERFIPNPFAVEPGARLYRTGDVARRMPDGQLDYLGRQDGQVKVRGFRVELSEIESVLCLDEAVRTAVVIAREDAPGEKRLVAYVVPAAGAAADADRLRGKASERLPEYMVPSAFVMMDALPLNANGKVDRKALPAPDRDDLLTRNPYVAPRNETELKLVRIWEEVIGVSPVGIEDDFFLLGGHSLIAVRLMARIEKEFGRKLPLSILIHTGTVKHFAEALTDTAVAGSSPLVAINPGGAKPPFFCIHPSGGGVLCYVDLSRQVGRDRPFYGLQDPVLDGRQRPYDSIAAMAADYLAALRAAQPEGPYLLGGYSFGGIVAFEMAQQLREAGQEIAALVMLDSMPPTSGKRTIELERRLGIDDSLILFLDAREQARQAGKEFTLSPAELGNLSPAERFSYVLGEVKRARLLPAEIGVAEVHSYLHMHRARRDAVRDYEWRPYPGRITLFRTKEPPSEPLRELGGLLDPELLDLFYDEQTRVFQDLTYGWQELSTEPVDVYDASGNHDTMLLEPHVRPLGGRLAQYLDGAKE
jgi:thioesterase domain-containing protein/acyl carrier protein